MVHGNKGVETQPTNSTHVLELVLDGCDGVLSD